MSFSFHRPRLLRFGRSSSRPSKSTADACSDAGVSSAGLGLSHALSSGPSEQDVDAAPRVARLSVSGDPIGSTDSLNRAPVDFAGQLSSASRPVTPTVPIISPHDSVVQPGIQLAPPSDDTQSDQAQRYLAPPHSPYGLTTPSEQSFLSETTTPPASSDSPQLRQQNGMFRNPHNFSIRGSCLIDI
ncbi:hypothetical protein Agabi119p4_8445 [Agaricus bisporus var. burnettii]|uniref:Uncharacterized protein n=1 Tax=Agaricus bisporus var. burnettii TaxID=192524 RepID=A0A8H7C5U9_AGABI|nr:hypothetical protein Agabi119p4_8445 [Agaricus bisporus var. burnettii]